MEQQGVMYTNFLRQNNNEYDRAIQELLQRQIKSIEVCTEDK